LILIYQFHTTPFYFSVSNIHLILSSHICLGLSSKLLYFGFSTKILYAFLFSHMRATCTAHLILLDLIIITILGEEYKLRSSSLCNFIEPPVISSCLVKICSSVPVLKHPESVFLP
jgi:hypothetical protein